MTSTSVGTETQARSASLCTMCVGDETFGISTLEVHEVLGECGLHAVPLAPGFVGGVISYRGDVLLVLCSRKLLGLSPTPRAGAVLVLRDTEEGALFGLAVDAVDDVVDVGEAQYEPNPCTLDARRKAFFAGAYKRENGVVVRLETALLRPERLRSVLSDHVSAER